MSLTIAHWASTCGILGNIISFMVFLSPVPTFYSIYKRKSTQGFQAIPYSVALFSAMLYLYYAYLKKNALLLITINTAGVIIESIYLTIFVIYATREARVSTVKLLGFFNFCTFGFIVLFTYVFSNGHARVSIVGWFCAAFSLCVFAAPLAIMRKVIKTKSVEFMPFYLSFFLTLCAITWFVYGLLVKDFYVATPNVLGITFGIVQMVLYGIYKDEKKKIIPREINLPQVVVEDSANNNNITKDLMIRVVVENEPPMAEQTCKMAEQITTTTGGIHQIVPIQESDNIVQVQV